MRATPSSCCAVTATRQPQRRALLLLAAATAAALSTSGATLRDDNTLLQTSDAVSQLPFRFSSRFPSVLCPDDSPRCRFPIQLPPWWEIWDIRIRPRIFEDVVFQTVLVAGGSAWGLRADWRQGTFAVNPRPLEQPNAFETVGQRFPPPAVDSFFDVFFRLGDKGVSVQMNGKEVLLFQPGQIDPTGADSFVVVSHRKAGEPSSQSDVPLQLEALDLIDMPLMLPAVQEPLQQFGAESVMWFADRPLPRIGRARVGLNFVRVCIVVGHDWDAFRIWFDFRQFLAEIVPPDPIGPVTKVELPRLREWMAGQGTGLPPTLDIWFNWDIARELFNFEIPIAGEQSKMFHLLMDQSFFDTGLAVMSVEGDTGDGSTPTMAPAHRLEVSDHLHNAPRSEKPGLVDHRFIRYFAPTFPLAVIDLSTIVRPLRSLMIHFNHPRFGFWIWIYWRREFVQIGLESASRMVDIDTANLADGSNCRIVISGIGSSNSNPMLDICNNQVEILPEDLHRMRTEAAASVEIFNTLEDDTTKLAPVEIDSIRFDTDEICGFDTCLECVQASCCWVKEGPFIGCQNFCPINAKQCNTPAECRNGGNPTPVYTGPWPLIIDAAVVDSRPPWMVLTGGAKPASDGRTAFPPGDSSATVFLADEPIRVIQLRMLRIPGTIVSIHWHHPWDSVWIVVNLREWFLEFDQGPQGGLRIPIPPITEPRWEEDVIRIDFNRGRFDFVCDGRIVARGLRTMPMPGMEQANLQITRQDNVPATVLFQGCSFSLGWAGPFPLLVDREIAAATPDMPTAFINMRNAEARTDGSAELFVGGRAQVSVDGSAMVRRIRWTASSLRPIQFCVHWIHPWDAFWICSFFRGPIGGANTVERTTSLGDVERFDLDQLGIPVPEVGMNNPVVFESQIDFEKQVMRFQVNGWTVFEAPTMPMSDEFDARFLVENRIDDGSLLLRGCQFDVAPAWPFPLAVAQFLPNVPDDFIDLGGNQMDAEGVVTLRPGLTTSVSIADGAMIRTIAFSQLRLQAGRTCFHWINPWDTVWVCWNWLDRVITAEGPPRPGTPNNEILARAAMPPPPPNRPWERDVIRILFDDQRFEVVCDDMVILADVPTMPMPDAVVERFDVQFQGSTTIPPAQITDCSFGQGFSGPFPLSMENRVVPGMLPPNFVSMTPNVRIVDRGVVSMPLLGGSETRVAVDGSAMIRAISFSVTRTPGAVIRVWWFNPWDTVCIILDFREWAISAVNLAGQEIARATIPEEVRTRPVERDVIAIDFEAQTWQFDCDGTVVLRDLPAEQMPDRLEADFIVRVDPDDAADPQQAVVLRDCTFDIKPFEVPQPVVIDVPRIPFRARPGPQLSDLTLILRPIVLNPFPTPWDVIIWLGSPPDLTRLAVSLEDLAVDAEINWAAGVAVLSGESVPGGAPVEVPLPRFPVGLRQRLAIIVQRPMGPDGAGQIVIGGSRVGPPLLAIEPPTPPADEHFVRISNVDPADPTLSRPLNVPLVDIVGDVAVLNALSTADLGMRLPVADPSSTTEAVWWVASRPLPRVARVRVDRFQPRTHVIIVHDWDVVRIWINWDARLFEVELPWGRMVDFQLPPAPSTAVDSFFDVWVEVDLDNNRFRAAIPQLRFVSKPLPLAMEQNLANSGLATVEVVADGASDPPEPDRGIVRAEIGGSVRTGPFSLSNLQRTAAQGPIVEYLAPTVAVDFMELGTAVRLAWSFMVHLNHPRFSIWVWVYWQQRVLSVTDGSMSARNLAFPAALQVSEGAICAIRATFHRSSRTYSVQLCGVALPEQLKLTPMPSEAVASIEAFNTDKDDVSLVRDTTLSWLQVGVFNRCQRITNCFACVRNLCCWVKDGPNAGCQNFCPLPPVRTCNSFGDCWRDLVLPNLWPGPWPLRLTRDALQVNCLAAQQSNPSFVAFSNAATRPCSFDDGRVVLASGESVAVNMLQRNFGRLGFQIHQRRGWRIGVHFHSRRFSVWVIIDLRVNRVSFLNPDAEELASAPLPPIVDPVWRPDIIRFERPPGAPLDAAPTASFECRGKLMLTGVPTFPMPNNVEADLSFSAEGPLLLQQSDETIDIELVSLSLAFSGPFPLLVQPIMREVAATGADMPDWMTTSGDVQLQQDGSVLVPPGGSVDIAIDGSAMTRYIRWQVLARPFLQFCVHSIHPWDAVWICVEFGDSPASSVARFTNPDGSETEAALRGVEFGQLVDQRVLIDFERATAVLTSNNWRVLSGQTMPMPDELDAVFRMEVGEDSQAPGAFSGCEVGLGFSGPFPMTVEDVAELASQGEPEPLVPGFVTLRGGASMRADGLTEIPSGGQVRVGIAPEDTMIRSIRWTQNRRSAGRTCFHWENPWDTVWVCWNWDLPASITIEDPTAGVLDRRLLPPDMPDWEEDVLRIFFEESRAELLCNGRVMFESIPVMRLPAGTPAELVVLNNEGSEPVLLRGCSFFLGFSGPMPLDMAPFTLPNVAPPAFVTMEGGADVQIAGEVVMPGGSAATVALDGLLAVQTIRLSVLRVVGARYVIWWFHPWDTVCMVIDFRDWYVAELRPDGSEGQRAELPVAARVPNTWARDVIAINFPQGVWRFFCEGELLLDAMPTTMVPERQEAKFRVEFEAPPAEPQATGGLRGCSFDLTLFEPQCVPPASEWLETEFAPVLDVAGSGFLPANGLDRLTIAFDVHRKYAGLISGFPGVLSSQVTAVLTPHTSTTGQPDPECWDHWTLTVGWAAMVGGCARSEVAPGPGNQFGFLDFTCKLTVEGTETLQPIRGLPLSRVVHWELPFVIQFPRSVAATLQSLGAYRPPNVLAAIVRQEVVVKLDDLDQVSATILLFTSVQYPFMLESPQLLSVAISTRPGWPSTFDLVQTAFSNCPNVGHPDPLPPGTDLDAIACAQAFRMRLFPDNGARGPPCELDGTYRVGFTAACIPAAFPGGDCPLVRDDLGQIDPNVAFDLILDSENFCAQLVEVVDVVAMLRAFKDASHVVPATNIVVNQHAYFVMSASSPEVSIVSVTLDDVVVSVGGSNFAFLLDKAINPAYDLVVTDPAVIPSANEAWFDFSIVDPPFAPPVDGSQEWQVTARADVEFLGNSLLLQGGAGRNGKRTYSTQVSFAMRPSPDDDDQSTAAGALHTRPELALGLASVVAAAVGWLHL